MHISFIHLNECVGYEAIISLLGDDTSFVTLLCAAQLKVAASENKYQHLCPLLTTFFLYMRHTFTHQTEQIAKYPMQGRVHDHELNNAEVQETSNDNFLKALEGVKSSALKQEIETLVLENDLEGVKRVLQTSAQFLLNMSEPKLSHALLGDAIQDAVNSRKPDVLSHLLANGGDVSQVEMRNIPLRPAHTTIAILEVMLTHGWDINSEADFSRDINDTGQTTLCFFVQSLELVKWMLEHGADANVRSRRDWTPLEYATSCSSPEVVKLMVSFGGDLKHISAFPNSMTNSRWRPMMEFLLEQGCDINAYSHWFNPDHMRCNKSAYDRGYTPLEWAMIVQPQLDKLHWLLQHGADPNAKDHYGDTAYDFAARCRVRDPMEILLQYAAPNDPHRSEPTCLEALKQDSLEEDKANNPDMYEGTTDESEESE